MPPEGPLVDPALVLMSCLGALGAAVGWGSKVASWRVFLWICAALVLVVFAGFATLLDADLCSDARYYTSSCDITGPVSLACLLLMPFLFLWLLAGVARLVLNKLSAWKQRPRSRVPAQQSDGIGR
jgi:hypothetical protein